MTENTEKIKILIVEDETLAAVDLASGLEELGYVVCGRAAAGHEALELAELHQPDLVMMNIVLKGDMDGLEAAGVIRNKWEIPVIFLTAPADSDLLKSPGLALPLGCVPKPFQDEDLKMAVDTALYVAKVDAERRKVARELQYNKERLHAALAVADSGTWEWDLKTKKNVWSQELWGLYALEPHSCTPSYKAWLESIRPDDRKKVEEALKKSEAKVRRKPESITEPEGDIDFLELADIVDTQTIQPPMDDLSHLIGIGVAILDRKGNVLVTAGGQDIGAKFHRLLAENARDVIWIRDMNLKLSYVSPSVEKVRGYTSDEVLHQNLDEILTPESKEFAINTALPQFYQKGFVEDNPYRFVKKSGKVIDVLMSAIAEKDENGSIIRILAVINNITDRLRAEQALHDSEEKYRTLYEQSEDAIFLRYVDRKTGIPGKFYDVNPTAVRRLEYPVEKLLDMTPLDLTSPDFILDSAPLRRSMIAGKSHKIEMIMLSATGKEIWVEALAHSFRYHGDDVAMVVARDIRERKELEVNLKSTLVEKDGLLKELHHRVKNNMQVIISLLKLQSDQLSDPKLISAFNDLESRIYAMSAIHETLHESENPTIVDLPEYLETLSESVFHIHWTGLGSIEIQTSLAPIEVSLEKSYPIGLIINELLSNSFKHVFPENSDGGISISSECTNDALKLVISDDGVGLPPDFDWMNVDSLGLQLVHTLVNDQLGGVLELDRSYGTRWRITIPNSKLI